MLETNLVRHQHYINGEWQDGKGAAISVLNKYTQEKIVTLQLADASQIEVAIASSVEGFAIIKTWAAEKRAFHLNELHQLLTNKRSLFVDLIIAESGKPISYAETELNRSLRTLEIAAQEALRLGGEYVPIDFDSGKGKTAFTKRFPIGVVSCITPFNFPLNLVMHKVAPALAAGCTILLKPSSLTPLTALAFTALFQEAGYPKGIINTIICEPPEAELLVADTRIKMLSFTGSDKVGWHLKQQVAHPQMKIALELGGNAPVLVADVENKEQLTAIANQIAYSSFLYAGQICISTQIIYVLNELFDIFSEKLLIATKAIASGNPALPATVNGSMIDKKNLQRIDSWVKEAVTEGATILEGGYVADEQANIYAPTLLTNVDKNSQIFRQEAFAPVVILQAVASFQEGIEKCNDTIYGLQAAVFTTKIERMKYAHEQLDYGGVMINTVPGFRVDAMPYGGVKASGIGKEGVTYTIQEMTEPKLLVF